ncbi:hypothetical protein CYMTET_45737, partial [Cymbomonas tetramitiformis]
AFLDDLNDLAEEREQQLPERRAAANLFRWDDNLTVTRAPGRLDVMGGIADYSGSLVLEMPVKEACHVALQRHPPAGRQPEWRHTAERHERSGGAVSVPTLSVVSFGADATNRAPAFDMDLSDFLEPLTGEPITYSQAREYFAADVSRSWAAYIAGTVLVLMKEKKAPIGEDGLSILVHSEVPEGKGVSSSAAIEVATMSAIAAAYSIPLTGTELASLCQTVENRVVGAPCGIMDQMTSACGDQGKLLALLCQPAEMKESVSIPSHIAFWGIDSGIRHSVGGSDYGSVRVGAFMGKRMISAAASGRAGSATEETVSAVRPCSPCLRKEGFHLVEMSPHEFERAHQDQLPETISGETFQRKIGDHQDAVTAVIPEQSYAVRLPTAHPVYENFRTELFSQVLMGPSCEKQLQLLGELMYQAHQSYSRIGLGSHGTDRLVALVEEASAAGEPLYGAKITGGGSGGTVCVLGKGDDAEAAEAIKRIVEKYRASTGHEPYVFSGSSPGACAFGSLVIRRANRLEASQ